MRSRIQALVVLLLSALTAGCGGGGGSGGGPGASQLSYAENPARFRVGEAAQVVVASLPAGGPWSFSVSPPLPSGLVLDAASGAVSGTAQQATGSVHTVTAQAGTVTHGVALEIRVGAALPGEVASLAAGFEIERLATGLAKPAKIARAPDGRIFFSEVDSGNVMVLDPVSGQVAGPVAQVGVLGAGHRGLLGLALAPDFAQTGHLFVMATVPAGGGQADRGVVLRFTIQPGSPPPPPEVVLDDLPIAILNNGGELLFDGTGHLLVSLGDAEVPANAQADASGSLSGKVLRVVPGIPASVPSDGRQPFPGSFEWCRGLRNTFGLAVHPVTGDLFGVDNGPASDDELNYLAPGRNFGWGAAQAPPSPGHRILFWPTVIVPTAIEWHDGTGFGPDHANDLFLASYDDQAVRRLEMGGPVFADVEAVSVFCQFAESGVDNKPLDLLREPDGSLLIATFTAIYRVRRI